MNSVMKSFWSLWPFNVKTQNTSTRQCSRSRSRNRPFSSTSEPLIQYLGPWEANMITLQSILIWEKPGKSAVALLSVNLIYWYIAINGIQLYYGISMLGLVTFLHHQWVYSIWPEISIKSHADHEDWTPVHPSVFSAPEVSRYIERFCSYIEEQQLRLLHLRKKQPGIFCLGMTFFFFLLWLLGRCIPGGTLLYILIMGVMCGPAILIHVIPKSVYSCLQNVNSILFFERKMGDSCTSIESDIAEFLPEETSADVQSALTIPLTPSEITFDEEQQTLAPICRSRGKKSYTGKSGGRMRNSSGASFTTGLTENDFPTIEDSLNTVEESDLALPEIVSERNIEEACPEGITFVSTHFGDSSDDEDFTTGLSFKTDATDHQLRQLQQTATPLVGIVDRLVSTVAAEQATNIMSSLSQHLASAMNTGAKNCSQTQTPISSTSGSSSIDEEFEFISDDDIQ